MRKKQNYSNGYKFSKAYIVIFVFYFQNQPQQPPPPLLVFLYPIVILLLLLFDPPLPGCPSGLFTEYYSFPTLIPLLSLLKSYTPLSILS